MRKLVISFALLMAVAAGALGQEPSSSPVPKPSPPPSSTPGNQTSQAPSSTQRMTASSIRSQPNFPLNPVSESDRLAARVVRLNGLIGPLYKKPGAKETAALAPDAALVQRYSALLRNEGTGIVRLAPDSGCVFSERVVNVREECLKYSFPGAGNSFSFRTDGYRLRHLADITYAADKLRITGVFMHGIVADIGDVPIETATLATAGMKFLVDFQPSTSADDVAHVDSNLIRGVKVGNFVYSKEVDPRADRTYALRAVAYRGKVLRAAGGVRYNELDYDKRRDVIIVFRIVQMNDGGITLVWRKLADREPPRVRMPKADNEKSAGESEAN